MFNDIGALEIIALVLLAVIIFGPDKLPKVIQDASRFLRKIREFSESAKQDIRSELGPDFKDFEFEDLNPKTFVRKQLMENEDLKELRSSFDLRKDFAEVAELKKDMADVADAVHGRDTAVPIAAANGSAGGSPNGSTGAATTPDLLKKRDNSGAVEYPPFDADAT